MNRVRILVRLATLTALLLWAGHALGGQGGLAFAPVLAGAFGMLANAAVWGALLGGGQSSEDGEGGTHPPTKARVARLEAMAVRGLLWPAESSTRKGEKDHGC
mgnify:CR=1 FL=1